MKRIFLVLAVTLTFTLTGCLPETSSTELTQEEIEAIIDEYLDNENTVTTTYDLQTYEAAIVDMLAEAQTGVLGVVASDGTVGGTGSGVIYKKEGSTYYMVTNEHVIMIEDDLGNKSVATEIDIVYEKYGLIFTKADGNILNIQVLGYDATTDLAVIRFDSSEDFNVIPFGDSYSIEIGQMVYAIGNPLGFEYYGTVTSGIISGVSRYVQDDDFNATLLQHDAAISPGNSGGALLNSNGELIGINNMKIVLDDVSNIGFAIPSNTVKRIVEDLEDDGEITRPYLGISTNPYIGGSELGYGVVILVQEGGAAAAAGLQDDDIIIGYKNEGFDEFMDIYNFNDLKEAILNSSVGETIVIKYIRDGVEYESAPTQLGVHPDD